MRRARMFQQRHYIAVAQLLKEQKPLDAGAPAAMGNWQATVRAFVRMFNADGEGKFLPSKFRDACGYQDGDT